MQLVASWAMGQLSYWLMFYLTLTFAETGGLFMLAVRLLQLFSEDGRDYSKLVSLIGLFFQIRDDYSNLTSDEVVSLHETHNCIVVVHKMEDDSWIFGNFLHFSIRSPKPSARTWLRGSLAFRSSMGSRIILETSSCVASFANEPQTESSNFILCLSLKRTDLWPIRKGSLKNSNSSFETKLWSWAETSSCRLSLINSLNKYTFY